MHLLGCGREFRGIVLQFPPSDTKEDRKLGAYRPTHRFNQLGGETGVLGQSFPAVTVRAPVGGMPEELVDRIAVGPMNLDRVGLKLRASEEPR